MAIQTAREQLMLELINRARLDPQGEADRYAIGLNDGLAPGTIDASAKAPLAMNALLVDSSLIHSQWMIDNDVFSHTGSGGSDPGQRMTAAGYNFTGSWTWGENIAWAGTTGTPDLTAYIYSQSQGLFESAGHRTNILGTQFREIGLGQIAGPFTYLGTTYNASMITQNFAKSGSNYFISGVAFDDGDGDEFYSVGEARSGVSVITTAGATSTNSAGGYSYGVAAGVYDVTFSGGGLGSSMTVTVDVSTSNVKLDIINGATIWSSASLTLGSGATSVKLLGVADLDVTGSVANENIVGNKGANVLNGGGGADILEGGAGDDSINGGTDTDTVSYFNAGGGVTVNLGIMTPQNTGAEGTDTIIAVENIIGSSFDDNLTGDSNNNTIESGAGNDFIDGGLGNDTASFASAGVDLLVDINRKAAQATGVGNDTLRNFENATGGSGNDTLRGNSGENILSGRAGNDTLLGRAGIDTMIGGDGDDSYFVQQLGDIVTELFGEGNDTVRVYFDNYILTANVEEGRVVGSANILFGNELDNLLAGSGGGDQLHGGDGNDTLTGNGGGDTLFGDAGDDRLIGSAGADTLNGGADNDRLEGNDDIDSLDGGAGSDDLFGGGGRDFMTGGLGADRFVFDDADFGGNSFATADRILDFSQAENDSIDLRPTDADTTIANDQAFTFIASAAFSGSAGELRFIQSGGRTYVQGDTDGDGTSDFVIRLEGLTTLDAGDFLL